MLTHIIPAASFTVATTAPSLLSRASDALQWVTGHPTALVTFALTAAVLLLVGWAFKSEARRARPVLTATPVLPLEPQTTTTVVVLPARGER